MKWINDALGHEEGDRALAAAADIFRQTFRQADIMARIGGDEFAILAIDIAETNPEILIDRLQQKIDEYNNKMNKSYKMSMSCGTAVYDPETLASLDDLMAVADELMYAQKKTKPHR